jgi:FkbM family methyltransferase
MTPRAAAGAALRRVLQISGCRLYKEAALPYGLDFMRDISRLHDAREIKTFFDVGANVGQTATEALRFFPNATVYAFEPNPTAFSIMQSLSRPRMSPHNLALGSEAGTLRLFCNGTTRDSAVFHDPGAPAIDVACTTVDAFCRSHPIGQIDVLKIDTEGFDYDVLIGAIGMLTAGTVRFVFTEFFDGYGTDLVKVMLLLRPLGFRLIATYTQSVTDELTCSNALLRYAAPPSR